MAERVEKEKPKDHIINMENRYFCKTKAIKKVETTIDDRNKLFKLRFFNEYKESEIVSAKKIYCIVL